MNTASPPNQASLRKSFRNLRLVMAALLLFTLVQSGVLLHVSREGKVAIHSLDSEGLPSLRALAALQESLALFRLHSYEWLFVQDAEKPARAKVIAESQREIAAQTDVPLGTVKTRLDLAMRKIASKFKEIDGGLLALKKAA